MDPNPYIVVAVPIINAMLQVDPTLKILMSAGGTSSVSPSRRAAMTTWDTTIINSPALKGKIYGLTQHLYYEEKLYNGTPSRSVSATEGAIDLLLQQMAGTGLKLVIGERSHTIATVNNIATGDPNLATQWGGVIEDADFLAMISQKASIDRAQFFSYGVPLSYWHPIRENADGSLTLMPVGLFHQILGDLFYDRAFSVTTVSPKSSDGVSYSVRAAVFESKTNSSASLIAVNRDQSVDHVIQIQGMTGKILKRARLLTATSPTAETVKVTDLVVSTLGSTIALPHSSVLLLEYN